MLDIALLQVYATAQDELSEGEEFYAEFLEMFTVEGCEGEVVDLCGGGDESIHRVEVPSVALAQIEDSTALVGDGEIDAEDVVCEIRWEVNGEPGFKASLARAGFHVLYTSPHFSDSDNAEVEFGLSLREYPPVDG
jgi:hypothetical protein